MCTMESEQFLLKWNNFENNITSGFADLLQQEAMVDVTLAAEGQIVQAHKIILSICSAYFRNMFQVNPCQHPIVILKDVRYQELTDMLDFMYKGEANVREQDLPSFLKLAETLKIKGLEGNQAEQDDKLDKRYSQSQVSPFTKDFTANEKDIPTNDFLNKDSNLKKKRKRSLSPLLSSEPKLPPLSHSINMEIESNEGNLVKNSSVNPVPNIIMKEEWLSDNSSDSYGDGHTVNETVGVQKNAGPSTFDESCETIPQGQCSHNIAIRKNTLGQKIRRACKLCYSNKRLHMDRSKARLNIKRTTTFCPDCPDQPQLCIDCFKAFHCLWNPRKINKPLSIIWSFFKFDCLKNKSECKLCGKVFKASPKTGTASVKYHLNFAHQILRNDGWTQ